MGLLLTVWAAALLVPLTNASAAPTFSTGDVLVGAGGNTVQWRTPTGSLVKNMTTGSSSPSTTGMALDAAWKLYVTGFTSNIINTFKTDGTAGPVFSTYGYSHPESIVFDAAGNAYVGQQSGNRNIVKLSSAGATLASYTAAPEANKGTDRIDLAADQCTMYYTSQGKAVKRFNVCTNAQLSNITSALPGTAAYDIKIVPGQNGSLVADTESIRFVSDNGTLSPTVYDAAGQNCWRALALDATPGSFWAADNCTRNLYKFNIGTSAPVLTVVTGATSSQGIEGLAVAGGITAARQGDLFVAQTDTPDPVTENNPVDYLATVTNGGTTPTGPISLQFTLSGGTAQFLGGGNDWSCSISTLSCTRSTGLNAGASASDVELLVKAPAANNNTVSSTAVVSTTTQDVNPANNTDVESTTINPGQPGVGTGFCKYSTGCTIATAFSTNASDTTAVIAQFPPIANATGGEVYTLREESGAFCGGVQCTGNVANLYSFIQNAGYNENNPIRVIMIFDSSIAPGFTATATSWEEATPFGHYINSCQIAGIALPHPCQDNEFRQLDNSLRIETLWLPIDPRVGSLCFPSC